jgi:hypothetical protein
MFATTIKKPFLLDPFPRKEFGPADPLYEEPSKARDLVGPLELKFSCAQSKLLFMFPPFLIRPSGDKTTSKPKISNLLCFVERVVEKEREGWQGR